MGGILAFIALGTLAALVIGGCKTFQLNTIDNKLFVDASSIGPFIAGGVAVLLFITSQCLRAQNTWSTCYIPAAKTFGLIIAVAFLLCAPVVLPAGWKPDWIPDGIHISQALQLQIGAGVGIAGGRFMFYNWNPETKDERKARELYDRREMAGAARDRPEEIGVLASGDVKNPTATYVVTDWPETKEERERREIEDAGRVDAFTDVRRRRRLLERLNRAQM